ncbi:MAG: sigma factor regulator FecR [Chloroflexi bacterium]|nr:sigma factor regulator FecR [Chloroflexota bacterium]
MDWQDQLEHLARGALARNPDLGSAIDEAAGLLAGAERVVVFSGAGISTESGIPDFRSPGGVWTREDPSQFTFDKFLSDPAVRRRSWQRFRERAGQTVEPNAAHRAIADLHAMGKLDCVITQNVDGLHQEAGVPDHLILELHGNSRRVACLRCDRPYGREEILWRLAGGDDSPTCVACGGLLKTATISFGQAMPVETTAEAEQRSRQCDLMLVVGSTLVVYPAALMPEYALRSGARLVMVNLMETPLDSQCHVRIWAKAGDILPAIVARVRDLLEPARVPKPRV